MNPYRGPYRITQKFGCTGYKDEPPYKDCPHYHKGIDLAGSPSHCPIYATTPQSVIDRGEDNTKALFVRTRDAQGRWHIYYHLYAISVSKGDNIDNSIQVGLQGSTGNSTGPHLHYAVYEPGPWKGTEKNTPIDPTPFLEGDTEMTGKQLAESIYKVLGGDNPTPAQSVLKDKGSLIDAEGQTGLERVMSDIRNAAGWIRPVEHPELDPQAGKKLKDLKSYIERL